jgi:Na+-transporting NADH:ubiquinone oxidoreductase subunit C
MSDRLKSVLFAAALCLFCSIILTTASTGLHRFQQKNMKIDKHRNIIRSVGLVEEGAKVPADTVESLYAEYIQPLWVDPSGRLIEESQRGESDFPLYVYRKEGEIEAYIVPFNSRGLWGRIHGYLAIDNDGSTITGFTVYKHSETPGLGGEIEKAWFQKNWVGKKIVDRSGEFVSVGIAKGAVTDTVPPERQPHYVDGISGATMTGKYLTADLKEILENYEPVSIQFRKNLINRPHGQDGNTE